MNPFRLEITAAQFSALSSLTSGSSQDLSQVSQVLGIDRRTLVSELKSFSDGSNNQGLVDALMRSANCLEEEWNGPGSRSGSLPPEKTTSCPPIPRVSQESTSQPSSDGLSSDELGATVMIAADSRSWVQSRSIAVPDRRKLVEYVPVGTTVGRYRIVEPLGRGTFGAVHRARDLDTGQFIALKVVNFVTSVQEALSDPQLSSMHSLSLGQKEVTTPTEQANQEGLLMANLQHPGIMPIFDWGSTHEWSFLALQLCQGDLTACKLPMDPHTAMDITCKVGEVIDFMHRQGVIHRDIKPANILIDAGGAPLLSDFGLALPMGSDRQGLAGTPLFMSPEQLQGTWYDGRSDIYALGVTLYLLLTGKQPHEGSFRELKMRTKGPPVRLPSHIQPVLPSSLDEIVLRALEPDPRNRYQSAAELSQDLAQIRDGFPKKSPLEWSQKTQTNPLLQSLKASQSVLENEPEEPENFASLGQAYRQLRGLKPAFIQFHRALREHRERGNERGMAEALWSLFLTGRQLGHFAKTTEYGNRAVTAMSGIDPDQAAQWKMELERSSAEHGSAL